MARRMAAARRQNRNEEQIVTVEKVALITAAGKGMGAAIARELAATGYRVALMSPSGSAGSLPKPPPGVRSVP